MVNVIKRENIIRCNPIYLEKEDFGDATLDFENRVLYQEPDSNEDEQHTLFLNQKIEDLKEAVILETQEQVKQTMQEEYERLIEEGKQEAEKLLETAKAEALSFKEDVEKQVLDLLNQAKAEQQACIEEGERIKQEQIEEGIAEKNRLLKEAEPEIVAIVKAALDKIISQEMNYSEDWILCVIRKIMREDQVGTCLVHLHPDVLSRIEGEQIQYCTYVGDDTLTSYQLILECELGQIEFDLRRGLNRIKKELDLLLKGKVKA